MQKKFVCLAKSARQGGLCIAGKLILADGKIDNWFRPVGRTEASLPARDCTFNIGHVVTCEVSEYVPTSTQSENHKVTQQPNWQTLGAFPKQRFHSLLDAPSSLWSTGFGCSTRHGKNDKVSQETASATGNSLYFIKISSATIAKNDESYEDMPRRIKMRLTFT